MLLAGQLLGIADRNVDNVLFNPDTRLFANINFGIMHGAYPGADGEVPITLLSSITMHGFHTYYKVALYKAYDIMWDNRKQIRNVVWRYASILSPVSRARTFVFVDRTLCFSAEAHRQYTMRECFDEMMDRFDLEFTRTGSPLMSLPMFLAQKPLAYLGYHCEPIAFPFIQIFVQRTSTASDAIILMAASLYAPGPTPIHWTRTYLDYIRSKALHISHPSPLDFLEAYSHLCSNGSLGATRFSFQHPLVMHPFSVYAGAVTRLNGILPAA